MNRIALVLLLCLPLPSTAQERRSLTEEAAADVAAFYNRPGVVRLSDEVRIPGGTAVEADVAALGGPVRIGGTVRGDVLVINGELTLEPGALVTGSATVVGGAADGALDAVAGGVVVYPEPLRFRWEEDRLVALSPGGGGLLTAVLPSEFGRADLVVAVDGSYNRGEGLPVTFGPRLRFGRTNPTLLDLRLIYRTGSGLRLDADELGHDLRIEQYIGGHRAVRVGVGRHRTIDPIERNGVSDTENSLATFILHRDYRDHYSRRGWRAFLIYGGRTRPLDAGVEYRKETHGTVRSLNPWSLLDNDEAWRPQPRVAQGELSTLRGWAVWDTRNQREDPATGWLLRVDVEQGLEGELELSVGGTAPEEDGVDPVEPGRSTRAVEAEFTTVSLDMRRYFRLGPRTRLALRAAAAGSPDDAALPPQRQHVLGGEGSLPAFSRFAQDCGARDRPAEDLLPYYGCDRSVLLQAEARFTLFGTSRFGLGRRLGLDFDLVTTPQLVVFADAGRAWIERESQQDRSELGPSSFQFDLGAGIRLGRIGAYFAVPISHRGDGRVNFFVRLGPRL